MAIDAPMTAAAQWVAQEFAQSLALVVESFSGERPACTAELLSAAPAPSVPDFRWRQTWSGVSGDSYLWATETEVRAASEQALGLADAPPEELDSTFLEILNQSHSLLARALTGRLGREVNPEAGVGASEFPPDLIWAEVRAALAKPVLLFVGVSPALLGSLAAPSSTEVAPAEAPRPAATPEPNAAEESRTFDLLLDVELPVSVSFGHAFVPLKEALKLTTGSIIELGRAINEPVDVVVNNCVIARGEVVVVEGNFGIRIQQVADRPERLRSVS